MEQQKPWVEPAWMRRNPSVETYGETMQRRTQEYIAEHGVDPYPTWDYEEDD